MNTTETNDTEILEMMQTPMNEGLEGFPAAIAKMHNLAMQFERELHLGAGKYERTDARRGYANRYKPKTLNTTRREAYVADSAGSRFENAILPPQSRARYA